MRTPLKVGIFAQLLPGRAGGIETNLIHLLASLGASGSSDVHPVAIGPGDSSGWLRDRVANGNVLPWPVIRYQVRDSLAACGRAVFPSRVAIMLRRVRAKHSETLASEGHHVAAGLKLSAALRAQRVEIVHFPYQRYFETSLPFIFEPWDLQHLHYPENFTEKEAQFREHLYREACQRAALVVMPTRWGKRDLISKLGLDAGKIAVISRGPGELSSDSTVRPAQALPPRYIVYPAKFWPHKNHLMLFKALAHLRSKGYVVPLVCTGDPASAIPDVLRATISHHGLEHQISFLGRLERPELTAVLARAEILVFPSLFEGLGIPVLEAMTLGVPVACSGIGPLDEIAGGVTEQFDAKDPLAIARSIERLWIDDDRRKELVALGRRHVQRNQWTHAAREFVVCYKRIAGRSLSAEEKARFASLIQ